MGGDFQLVEQRFVIQAVGGKTVQIDITLRRKPDFIGEAGQIILPLAVAAPHGIHRFAAIAKFAQRLTDILHRRLIAAGKIFQIQHDTGDIAVIFRLANSLYDIKQRVFLETIGTGPKELTTDHAEFAAGGRFIDHHAGYIHQQRAASGMFRGAAAELCPDTDTNQNQQQENQVQCELANKVEYPPCPFKKSGEQPPKSSHVFSLTLLKMG